MKIKLLKDTRVLIEKGSIVDTPYSYAAMLVRSGYAVPFVEEQKEEQKKEDKPKKTTKKK